MSDLDYSMVKTVQRALRLLKCFSFEDPEQDLGNLSKKMGLHKSTVHRLVKTLETEGFLQKNEGRETYKLGIKLFELGRVVHDSMDLRNAALGIMKDLSHNAGFTVFLSTVVNGQKVCIEKVEGGQGLQPSIKLGQVVPLHVGSSGKVLLAFMSEAEVNEILGAEGLSAFTPHTVVERDELKKQLAEIRRNGYAIGFEEKIVGGAGVSAPIINHHGRVQAAISVVGAARAFENQAEALVPMITSAAKAISAKLGNLDY